MTRTPSQHHSALPAVSTGVGGAAHLSVDGVSKSFPDRRVLTDVSFTVSLGERACLIGENGTGKSTLLRIIAGLDDDHGGTITTPGAVGLFHQQPPFGLERTVDEVLAEATAPARAVAGEVTRLAEALADTADTADPTPVPSPTPAVTPASRPATGAPDDPVDLATAYDRALAEAIRTDAWDVDRQVERLVDGLDLARIPRDRPARELSGGQLSRLSLAWLLLRRPDTLLLDEPTNHLDARGTALLVDLLVGWTGPVLIASHDRAFLDETASTLLDLDPAPRLHADVQQAGGASGAAAGDDGPGSGFGITRFGGRYSDYLLHRIEERERWERRYRDEQAELKRLRQQVADSHIVGNADRGPRTEARASKKFYSDRNAKVVSRRVNDAATALARLEQEQVRKPPAVLRFGGLAAAASGGARLASGTGPVLVATQLALAGRLAPVSLALGPRSRLLVTGPNGAGKSTLLEILAGRLEPDAGSVTTTGRVTVGLLGQDTDQLRGGAGGAAGDAAGGSPGGASADLTVGEAYRAAVGPEKAEQTPLGTFGLIAGRDERRRVRDLSVGQRRRLDLAVLLADPPDVLLLDEPTNHFSLLLSTQLEASIPDYPGAVVVASHDRWLSAGWKGERLPLRSAAPASE